MPSTEAGKRLYQLWLTGSDYDTLDPEIVSAIEATEAEARKKALAEVYGYTRHCLERVRDAVEDLPAVGYEVDVREVLAIVERG